MTQAQPVGGRTQREQDLLADIRRRAPLPRDLAPEHALSAVTCALDQHVTGGESRHLFESLPGEVQPLLAPCLVHRAEPASRFGWDGLVRRVAEHLGIPPEDAEPIIPGVLQTLTSRLPRGAVEHVGSQLPEDIRRVWLGPTPPAPRVGPHEIVEEVERQVALPPGVHGERAVTTVMCTLSQRLPLGEARHLVESLPESVRAPIAPCLQTRGEAPDRLIDRAVFYARVAVGLQTHEVEPIIRAVFRSVKQYLPQDVVHHVEAQLPKDLEQMWHAA
jgi:uncharacterized protein (DUF2267 family)